MFCEVASADKGREAKECNKHREHDCVAPPGFHHEEGEEKDGQGEDDGCKEKSFEKINQVLFHYGLYLRRVMMIRL